MLAVPAIPSVSAFPAMPDLSGTGKSMDAYITRAKQLAAIEYAKPFDWEQFLPPGETETTVKAKLMPEVTPELTGMEWLKKWAEDIKGTGVDWVKKVTASGETFYTAVTKTSSSVAVAWGEVILQLANALKAIVELPIQVATAVGDLFNAIGNFGSMMTDAIDYMIEGIYNMVTGIGDIFERLIPKLINMAPQIINRLLAGVPVLIERIVDSIPVIIQAAADMIPDVVKAFIEHVPDIAKALIDSVLGMATGGIVGKGSMGSTLGLATTAAGAYYGTAFGMGVGSVLMPGFGTVAGGIVGGMVGATVGDMVGGIFHRGGVVGRDMVPQRAMPAVAFAGAPRLHSGLAPDEYPAILQRGERVLSRAETQRSGGETVIRNHITIDIGGRRMGTVIYEGTRSGKIQIHERAIVKR